MLTKRIIPCLDIKEGRTVKGTNFVDLRDAGELRPQFLDARRHAGARLAEQPAIRRAHAVDAAHGVGGRTASCVRVRDFVSV